MVSLYLDVSSLDEYNKIPQIAETSLRLNKMKLAGRGFEPRTSGL